MAELWDVDFTQASAGPLGDLTNPSYVVNADLDNLDVINGEGVRPNASAFRAWGPDIVIPSGGYRTSIYVQPNSGSGIAAMNRWSGSAWNSAARKGYVWNFHFFNGIQLFRHVDDTGGVLLYENATFVGDNNISQTDIIGLSIQVVTTDASTVTIDLWTDLGGGWVHQQTVTDTSVDRITTAGLPGVRSYNFESRVRSGSAESLVPEEEVFSDPFDNIPDGLSQELQNRTDPVSYDGATLASLRVEGTGNHLRFHQLEANRLFGPVVTPSDDGYVTEMTGFAFAPSGTNNYVEVLSRWDGVNFGTEAAYALRFTLSDGWRLIRYDSHDSGAGFDIRVFDTNYAANNALDETSVMSFRIKTEEVGTDIIINAWINHSGTWDHVVQDHADPDAERITAIGRPAYIMRRLEQTCDTIRAYYEVGSNLAIASVSPGIFRDGDTFTISGTFPETVTSVDVAGETQTINSQDSASVSCTFALGDILFGSATLSVQDSADSASTVVFVEPVAGNDYVTVARLPWPTGQESLFEGASPAVSDGMQAEWVTTTDLGDGFDLNTDGTGEIQATSGTHVVDARIHDGTERGPWASYTVTATSPGAPVANAGPNRSITVGQSATLDGSGSTADGGIDIVQWTQTSGTGTAISNDDSLQASVTPNLGEYTFQLEITDGFGQSDTDSMTVTVSEEDIDPDEPDSPDGGDVATLDKHDPSIMKVIPVHPANAVRTTKDFSTTNHVISDIPWDDEYATWNSGTSYNVGDRVSYQVVNLVPHIYEALVQTTPGRNPGVFNVDRHGVGHEWSEWATVSAVNAYRAWDQDGDTETRHASSFTYTIDSGLSVDYMAFMGLHADSVDIRVETSGGTILHNETYIPDPRFFADAMIVNDFPQVFPVETMFFITVNGSPARVTHILMGRQNLIGISQYGVELGFKDFSRIKRDDFGHLSVKPGRVVDTKRINVIIEAGFEHEVNSYMSLFTARRTLFVGSDEVGPYIFGIARRFRVLYSNPRQSECEIVVEGA